MFDSVWGGNPPPQRNTAWNKGRKCFNCLGAPNNLIRPWVVVSLIVWAVLIPLPQADIHLTKSCRKKKTASPVCTIIDHMMSTCIILLIGKKFYFWVCIMTNNTRSSNWCAWALLHNRTLSCLPHYRLLHYSRRTASGRWVSTLFYPSLLTIALSGIKSRCTVPCHWINPLAPEFPFKF